MVRTGEQEFRRALREAHLGGARVPDFFIVGHAKCGTTALHQMLQTHPQLYIPAIKETQFLSRSPQERAQYAPRTARGPARRPQTLDAYLSLFATVASAQRAGEASTEYLRTPGTAARIAELCPQARIIALFREPADFLRSLHLQLLEVNVESERDFASAIALEPERRQGRRVPAGCRWPPALHYSQHVHYVEQLREYHEHFGRERVLALIYDDFRADNEAVVRQVFRFLGIDDAAPIAQTEANPTVRVRASRVHGLVHDAALGRGAVLGATKTAVKAITPARLRRGALRTVNRAVLDDDPPAPDEQLMLELRRRFKDEVIAASAYLDRDLVTLWGYDRID